MKSYLLLCQVLFFTCCFGALSAQDCSCEDCPVFIPIVGTVSSCIDISGLTNGTLGENGQDVCEVTIDFEHSWIGDLNIALIAPDGSSVDLVFVGSIGGISSNTFWDVTFVQCSEDAAPDPGYADVFPSLDWQDGTFTGSYYPGDGCLEDLTGSANGQWCLEFEDLVGGDDGNVFGWSITFCDGTGTICGAAPDCFAEGGETDLSPLIYCQFDPDLLLNAITVDGENEDADYGYTFAITDITNGLTPIIEYAEVPDLTLADPGVYSICGLSYLLTDELLITEANGSNTTNDLQDDIDNGVFCGDLNDFCINITIIEEPTVTFDGPTEVCAGVEYIYSIVDWDPSLGTYGTTIIMGGFDQFIPLGNGQYSVIWNDAVLTGEICGNLTTTCGFVQDCISVTILPEPDPFDIVFQPTACIGQELTITWDEVAGNTYSAFVTEGNLSLFLFGPGTVTYAANTDDPIEICVSEESSCGIDTICASITVTGPVLTDETFVDTCGLDFDLVVLGDGLPIDGTWVQTSGPSTAVLATPASSTTEGEAFALGIYEFQFTADCGGTIDVSIELTPEFENPDIIAECEPGGGFVATITMTPGLGPYTINGEVVTSNIFVSEVLFSGTFFLVSAEQGCTTWILSANEDCDNCTTDAGSISAPDADICDLDDLIVTLGGDAVLDADDAGFFIVHTDENDPEGSSILITPDATIAYSAIYTFGVQYYVTYVVGNASGSSVDFSDPCLDFSNTVSFQFVDPIIVESITSVPQGGCGLIWDITVVDNWSPNGTWFASTIPAGGGATFSPVQGDITTVTFSGEGTYVIDYFISNGNCSVTVKDTLIVLSGPEINNVVETCLDLSSYQVSFDLSGGTGPYTVDGVDVGNGTFVSSPIPSGTSYSFLVVDASGCEVPLLTGLETCECDTDAGTMDANVIEVCDDALFTITNQGDEQLEAGDNLVYILHTLAGDVLGTILDESTIGNFGFLPSMTYGEVYYVSAVAGNAQGASVDLTDECLSVAEGQPVIFFEEPEIFSLTVNPEESCTGPFTLTASQSTTIDGIWTTVASPPGGVVVLSSLFGDVVEANVTVLGTYTMQYQIDNGPCIVTDQVTFTYAPGPSITNLMLDCTGDNSAYTVSFDIVDGTGPYTVSGVPITGSSFTSTPIVSGSSYTFEVVDDEGCTSEIVSGTFDCACTTGGGTMDDIVIEICGDALVSIINQGDEQLDANDNLVYILHTLSGNMLGTILEENTTGTFGFLPSMTYEVVYYVSAVAGDAQGVSVDLTDDCLSVAEGQPVVFFEEPEIFSLTASPEESCTGPFTLTASQSTTIDGIWTTVASPPGGLVVLSSLFGDVVEATVTESGTYTMQYQIDNGPCIVTDQVTFTLGSSPSTINQSIDCTGDNSAYTVSFEIIDGTGPYTVSGVPISGSNFTSAAITSGSSYSFEVVDASGCAANIVSGTFNCGCETNAGTMDAATIETCGSGPTTIVGNGDETLDFNDGLIYVLHTGTGAALGTVLDESLTGEFSFVPSMTYGVTYYVSVVVADAMGTTIDLTDDCLSVAAGQPVIFYEQPVISEIVNVVDDFCDDTVEITATVNIEVDGAWSITSSPAPGSGSLSTTVGTETILTTTLPGDYIVTYQVVNGPCTASSFSIVTYVEPVAVADVVYECNATADSFTAIITLAGGVAPYFVDGVEVIDTTFISSSYLSGSSVDVSVTDSGTCSPVELTLAHECEGCEGDPGVMPTDTIVLCESDLFVQVVTSGAVIGAGDSLVYVLHTGTGTTVVNPLQYSQTGDFVFDDQVLSLDVVYYISAVTFEGAIIDLEGVCTSVNVGTPVVWTTGGSIIYLLPEAVCFGEDIALTLSYDGALPAEVVYVDAEGNGYTLTVEQTGTQVLSLPFIDTEMIEFVSLTDGNGCLGIVADLITEFDIEVIDLIDITLTATVCNSSIQGSVIDLSTLLSTDDIEGTWQSPVGVLTGSLLDVDGVLPSTYTLVFEPTGDYPCGILSTALVVEDCPCPVVQLEPLSDVCQGDYTFDLNEQIPTSVVGLGSWSVIGAGGVTIEQESSLVIASDAVGNYEVFFTLTEVPDGCPEVFSFDFNVDATVSAGVPVLDEVEICIGDLTEILLFDYLDGYDVGGQWTTADGPSVDQLTGVVDITAAEGGLYTYIYMVPANGACPPSEASVILLLTDPLELFLDILDPLCFGQADGSVTVTNAQGAVVTDVLVLDADGNASNPDSLSGGNYSLTATTSAGCTVVENFTLVDPIELTLDLGDNILLQEGQSAAIIPVTNVVSEEISLYEWFVNQAELDTPTFDTLLLSPDEESVVQLIITDEDGCIVADDLLITILEETVPVVLPNVFNPRTSPFAVPAYEDIVLVNRLAIYDRWGGQVFVATDYDPSVGNVSWDGRYRGQAAATGVYVYALEYTDSQGRLQSLYGDVTLLTN